MVRCDNCGRQFPPRNIYHRVCDQCFRAWRRRSGSTLCADCSAEFTSQQPEHKYCDRCYQNRRPVLPLYPSLRGYEDLFPAVRAVFVAAVLLGLLHWLGTTLGWG